MQLDFREYRVVRQMPSLWRDRDHLPGGVCQVKIDGVAIASQATGNAFFIACKQCSGGERFQSFSQGSGRGGSPGVLVERLSQPALERRRLQRPGFTVGFDNHGAIGLAIARVKQVYVIRQGE